MGTTVYEGSENPPIVLIPSIFGFGVFEYTQFVKKFREAHLNCTILILNSPLLDNVIENEQFNTVEKQANFYLNEIKKLKEGNLLGNDLVILGYSYGGKVAYELSKQAIEKNFNVNYLGIIDTDMTEGSSTNFDTLFLVIEKLTSSLSLNNETLKKSVDELINKGKSESKEKNANREKVFENHINDIFDLLEKENKQLNSEKEKLQQSNQHLITSTKINLLANVDYTTKEKLDLDKVSVFQSNQHKELGWRKHLKNEPTIKKLDGNHFEILGKDTLIKNILDNISLKEKKLAPWYKTKMLTLFNRYFTYLYCWHLLKKPEMNKDSAFVKLCGETNFNEMKQKAKEVICVLSKHKPDEITYLEAAIEQLTPKFDEYLKSIESGSKIKEYLEKNKLFPKKEMNHSTLNTSPTNIMN